MVGGAGTKPDAYRAGVDHRVSGEGDAAESSRLSTAGSRGLGTIPETMGGLGLGPTEQ